MPKKKHQRSNERRISDHNLVSVVAPSIELFNKIHEACSVLENFGIPYETAIVAATNHQIRHSNMQVILKTGGLKLSSLAEPDQHISLE